MYHVAKLPPMNKLTPKTLGNCTGPKIKQALEVLKLSALTQKIKVFLLFPLEMSLEIIDLGKVNIITIINKY